MSTPTLVTVAHGTRVAAGNRVATAITAAAGRRLGVPGRRSYVELSAPLFSSVVRSLEQPAVVVPLLLSTGYHVRSDLPQAVRRASAPVRVARPLGPHPLLAEVMCLRLRGSGARQGDPVVLVAAGSRDPDASIDLASAGRMLQARWGAPVRVATLGGDGPSVADQVAAARAHGRVAVVPYLLAGGLLSRRAERLARSAGATSVANVLGPHPLVVELVVRRYRSMAVARAVTTAA
ncbi:MAG: sirohydrochlorin chelatase [Nocardioides sp.]